MSKYPLCEKLGLKINYFAHSTYIDAEDLERVLQNAQVVYGHQYEGQDRFFWNDTKNGSRVDSTHKALLLCVEEIKKECVEHEPEETILTVGAYKIKYSSPQSSCKHCGVKLKAKWEEA